MAYRFLYLVRHGQFDGNLHANPDGKLTTLGRRQARRAAKALAGIPVTAIHMSTLPRTLETAQPFIKAFPAARVERTRRLWECLPPIAPELRTGYFAHYTDAELARQAAHAARAYTHYFRRTRGKDRHEVLVTHGNLIRYLACRAMHVDPLAWVNLRSANCGITRVLVEPDGTVALLSYNDVTHLELDHLTDNL